jgi:Tol biopolymer transport system component
MSCATRAARAARPRCTAAALLAAATLAVVPAAARDAPPPSGGNFVVAANPYVLGQAVDWLDDGHVVWHDPAIRDEGGDGLSQIYRSTLDGGEKACLTCGLPGPNQVPVAQRHGNWILFHSWNGHALRVGGAGFGGIGSDVWVMTRDGRQLTNVTPDAEFHDNFHAYWSPDGRYIVWTALNWNSAEGGNGRSDIRVARFEPHGPHGPHLVGEHVVRPGNGHWYETQWWAPDGSGFLYTETVDTAINPELFFCRLRNRASGRCQPQRLTDNPAWDEQAIFTPDMSRIIFMSSRNLPGAQNDWAHVASFLEMPADFDYVLILGVFSDNYLQPVFQQATDLYEITLRWNRGHTRFKPGAVRRLTSSGEDGWVIPEFSWDPSGRRLLWSMSKINEGRRVDQGCLMQKLRSSFIKRLTGVDTVGQIPFGIDREMREEVAKLLRPPTSYAYQGACGGGVPDQKPPITQVTRIGRYEE